MRIIGKFKYGFWFLTKYYFHLEDEDECLIEMQVDQTTWEKFNIGDFMDSHYCQFFKYDDCDC